MRVAQRCWTAERGWEGPQSAPLNGSTDLVLAFGSTRAFIEAGIAQQLRSEYPQAVVVGCSTAGQIRGTRVGDDEVAVTAIDFERTELRTAQATVRGTDDTCDAGRHLGEQLRAGDLAHVLIFCDGPKTNADDLIRGLSESLPAEVAITGGVAGDGPRGDAFVLLDESPRQNATIALGLYGKHLKVSCGSAGGWRQCGPERIVTRSEANVLYELAGRPALAVYEAQLGEYADRLPQRALLFPLSIRTNDPTGGVIRTVLGIDRERQSITLAADVPQGSYARVMQADHDRLIEGARLAADACDCLAGGSPQLGLIVSCVGRQSILKNRVVEELEAVRDVFGPATALAGFYGSGEIAPTEQGNRPQLHNQTVTVTAFSEE